ncbi:hypothetical protein C9426_29070 [Serratia sp. S1B]|nr:hypothetical protein C9426_29070 [Serratia sp. S1B]
MKMNDFDKHFEKVDSFADNILNSYLLMPLMLFIFIYSAWKVMTSLQVIYSIKKQSLTSFSERVIDYMKLNAKINLFLFSPPLVLTLISIVMIIYWRYL